MTRKPTQDELVSARNKTVRDIIAPGLRVLFCGINPGLYSAAMGHHFARPGNRFWPALHAAGFTDRQFLASEGHNLLQLGYGITNIVERTTASAQELSSGELIAGIQHLELKVEKYRPKMIAILGISAYRIAFSRPRAILGQQRERLSNAAIWILPNPSGLNAHYSLSHLAVQFGQLRVFAENLL